MNCKYKIHYYFTNNSSLSCMVSNRKQQKISTAAKRFARHGLWKTNLDEIARDVNVREFMFRSVKNVLN